MKKHFLILMLMALLPLAGWAQTSTFGNVSVGKYTYGAALPTPIVKDVDGYPVNENYYEVSNTAYSEQACTNAVAPKNMKADGTQYWLKITGVDGTAFEGAETSVYFTVEKAVVTIALNQNAQLKKTYGATDPTVSKNDLNWAAAQGFKFDLVGTGNENEEELEALVAAREAVFTGTLTYTHEGVNANNTPYPVSFSGLTADCYTLSLDQGILIEPKVIEDSWFGTDANAKVSNVVYQGANVTPEYTIKDGNTTLEPGTDYEFDYGNNNPDLKNVTGNNAIVVTVKGKGNYTTANNNAGIECSLNITKAPMSVAIANIHLPYKAGAYVFGDINTEIAALVQANKSPFTYYGFVGEDVAGQANVNITAPAVTAVATNLDAGTYDLTYSQATTANYSITQIATDELAGKFVIDPFEVNITPKQPVGKKVGETDPALEYDIEAAKEGAIIPRKDLTPNDANDDSFEAIIATEPVLTRGSGETVGNYPISYTTEATTTANYTIKKHVASEVETDGKYKSGPKFTISASSLVLTILNKSKLYGEPDSKYINYDAPQAGKDYIVSGLMSGDALTGIKLKRANSDKEGVGHYSITLAEDVTLDKNKYEDMTVIPGDFAINQAPLAIVIADQTMKTGQSAADIDKSKVKITGLKNGDTIDDVIVLGFANNVATTVNNNVVVLSNPYDYAAGIKYTYPLKTVNNQQVATKNKNYLYPEDQENGVAATGRLIVINAASTLLLNRVTKDDFATAKNDAATEIAKAAAASKEATYFTEEEITAHNNELDVWTTETQVPATYYTTQQECDEANAGLQGALQAGAPLTEAQATAYNTAMNPETNKAENDVLTEEEAAAYNATLGDAVEIGDVKVAAHVATQQEANAHNETLDWWVAPRQKTAAVKYDVTFSDFEMAAERWYSLTLPFATTVKEVSDAFGYAVVDIFDVNSNISNDVMFRLHMGELPANEPFIVKIYETKNMNTVKFDNKLIENSDDLSLTDKTGNKFIGSYSGIKGFEPGKKYFFSTKDGNIKRAGSSTYLYPLAAYITTVEVMDGMSAAPRILIEEPDGSTTAINPISVENKQDAEGWYNINGMKLNNAPAQKGVYIKNGKKVIVK